ncbi:MAG: hypothetical protein OEY07_10990, partial [Gammaproteobacteria bacterium]|nr:hypothetical protein [Gammaproteobacteria bacterium]
MKVTDYTGIYGNGTTAKIDAHGNNIAFACSECSHPVLAIVRDHQRGSSRDNPAICKGCGETFLVEVNVNTDKVIVNR